MPRLGELPRQRRVVRGAFSSLGLQLGHPCLQLGHLALARSEELRRLLLLRRTLLEPLVPEGDLVCKRELRLHQRMRSRALLLRPLLHE